MYVIYVFYDVLLEYDMNYTLQFFSKFKTSNDFSEKMKEYNIKQFI